MRNRCFQDLLNNRKAKGDASCAAEQIDLSVGCYRNGGQLAHCEQHAKLENLEQEIGEKQREVPVPPPPKHRGRHAYQQHMGSYPKVDPDKMLRNHALSAPVRKLYHPNPAALKRDFVDY